MIYAENQDTVNNILSKPIHFVGNRLIKLKQLDTSSNELAKKQKVATALQPYFDDLWLQS